MSKNTINKKSIAALLGLLLVSCLFIFIEFIFGNKLLVYTDIGSDTYDQYMLYYQSIINHIRDGNFSLWDFNNGYGVNMFTYNLFNPFLLLLYLFGVVFGAEQIYGAMVYLVILHIILAGIAIYLFLSCFGFAERAKVIASYAYALCGYMVVWGQHYQFGIVVITIPLLLMAVEWAFCKSKGYFWLTVFCAIVSFSSVYMAYMQFIVLGFYVLFRVAWEKKIFSIDGIKRIGKYYGSMILGIGIGFLNLLPSAFVILNVTERVPGESFTQRIIEMLTFYPVQYYEVLIKKMLSNTILGVNEYMGYLNFYEDPNVFLSALLIIALIQFLYFFFTEKYTKKQRFLLVLATGLFAFMLLIPLGSAIFNALSYPFARQTFLCMPFAVWVIAYVIHKVIDEKKCNIPLLCISVIGITACYYMIFDSTGKKVPLLLAVLTIGMGCGILGYIILKKKRLQELSFLMLVACLVMTMSGDAYLVYSRYRNTLEKNDQEYMAELYDSNIEEAISYIESIDSSFYRIEKDYNVGMNVSCLNSMAQNYRGVSTYNSMLNTNISDMYVKLWPNTQIVDWNHRSFSNAANESVPASISNVKYVLSKSGEYSAPGFKLLKQFGDVYVYRNMNTEQIAKFYNNTISVNDYDQISDTGNRENLLTEYLVCDSLFQYQRPLDKIELADRKIVGSSELIYMESVELIDESAISICIKDIPRSEDKQYTMEFDIAYTGGMNYISIFAGGTQTQVYITPTAKHLNLTLPTDDDTVYIQLFPEMSLKDVQISNIVIYECKQRNFSALSEGIYFDNPKNDNTIVGKANISEPGILMLAIPYEDGWHAYVDGEEVDIHKVNFGFCGIVLNEGEHEIEFRFDCPGFTMGAIGSALCLILTVIIWCVICSKKNSYLVLEKGEVSNYGD